MKIRNYLAKYGGRLAAAVVLVVLLLLLAGSRSGKIGFLRDADGALKTPVQKASTAILDWVEGVYGRLYGYDLLLQENESLRGEIAELREEARDYEELEAENRRLRALCDLREQHTDFVFESAKVIAWDSSNYTSAFTVGKGSAMGIEAGDPVVTEYGILVGQFGKKHTLGRRPLYSAMLIFEEFCAQHLLRRYETVNFAMECAEDGSSAAIRVRCGTEEDDLFRGLDPISEKLLRGTASEITCEFSGGENTVTFRL